MSSFCVVAPMQHKKASSDSPTLVVTHPKKYFKNKYKKSL
ncbi:hypothetical protein JCM19300_2485 [Algibacter lectus]|uniref:Uncharacterized protein n=1 Tax=Algibacter lectus TaxID=221126 RepID=A0A090W4J9_9FLAO|nr:hypothetical protein JCM19300_2485 [Algibacter lectus]GAL79180.1 hypothetical protein JCM19274_4265 [Algibacter lectus]